MTSGAVKDHKHTYKFYLNHSLTNLLNMTMVRNFEVTMGQTLNHCVELCDYMQCHISVSTVLNLLFNNARKVVRNFEVMMGQTLNHCVEFCDYIQSHIFETI
jgi:hypothetical protein